MAVRRIGGGGQSLIDLFMDDIHRIIEEELGPALAEEEARAKRDNSPKPPAPEEIDSE